MTNNGGTGADVGRVLIKVTGTGLTSASYSLDYSYISYVIVDRLYIHSGVCQAGSTSNTIVFDTLASSVNGAYDPSMVFIQSGTGSGQTRLILQYDGITQTAVVDRGWKVIPDITSVFQIVADPGREHVNEGLARAGGVNTIQLNTSASDDDNGYVGQIIFIRSGAGEDQARRVGSYDGTTKIATVSRDWVHIPDATSAYVMLPTGALSYNCIREAVWQGDIDTYNDVAGSFGKVFSTNIDAPISDVGGTVWDELTATHSTAGTFGKELSLAREEAHRARALATNKVVILSAGTGINKLDTITIYDDNGSTVLYTITVTGETPTDRNVLYEKPF
jgi:hypothetical protein